MGKMGGRLLRGRGGGGVSQRLSFWFFHVSLRGNGNISSLRNGGNKPAIASSVTEMRVPAEVATGAISDGWKNGVIRFRIILPLES